MERHNSQTLTDYPDHLTSTTSSPSLSRRSTDSHSERRNSKMGHIMASIREALAQEQERLFPKTKSSHHPIISGDSDHINQQDKLQQLRVQQEKLWEADDEAKESISPAIEARPSTWGWPGLGTYPEPTKHLAQPRKLSRSDKAEALEPRFEAATMEAIDNAAESESFGWPGLGSWTSSKK